MKTILFSLVFSLVSVSISSQTTTYPQQKIFSSVYFVVLGGTSFNTIPTVGSTISFEVKTNVISNLFLKFNVGYTTLYDDDSYEVKSYGYSEFTGMYNTRWLLVERVEYKIIPVNIGVEYNFLQSLATPFAILELGYNFSTAKTEGITHDGIAGSYDTIEEIPEDYRQIAPALEDGSSFALGAGVGLKLKLTNRMDINLRYVYRYNDSIVNNNQILIGLTF